MKKTVLLKEGKDNKKEQQMCRSQSVVDNCKGQAITGSCGDKEEDEE